LKRVGADERLRDLAGDGDERHGVEFGVGDGGEQVGGAGAGGGQADGGAAGGAGHALGDEAGALFVAREHVADGAAVKRVVEGQDGAAGDAGDGADALPFEQDSEEMGSGGFHDDGWG